MKNTILHKNTYTYKILKYCNTSKSTMNNIINDIMNNVQINNAKIFKYENTTVNNIINITY